MDLEERISESLKRIVNREFSIPEKSLSLPFLEIPKDFKFGDLSTNIALKLSKDLGKPSFEIASKICSHLNKDSQLLSDIQDLKIAEPGFINFFLRADYFYKVLKEILKEKSNFGRRDFGKRKKVLIEFVSANPTGPLSVAHGRQAAVGDVLANILEFCGFRVKREYYINDVGTQIDLLAKSISARYKELLGEETKFPLAGYRGEYIYNIAKKIIDSQKKYTLDLEFFKDFGIRYILNTIKRDLRDFRVRFDNFYSERALRETRKIRDTISILKRNRFLYEEANALWFKSTKFGDDKDRVIIKSNGELTYLLPDIAYHRDKFERGFDWLINFWGPDHHGYISRLKAALIALGYKEDKISIKIIQLATIYKEGRPVSISTRRGQIMALREIMDNVDVDVARFFFLMRRLESHLDFDLELAKKRSLENPVYYIQYAYARICSILDNVKIPYKKICNSDLSLLRSPFELEILKLISRFGYTIRICYQLLDPFPLTSYLMGIAGSFHKFYENVRVLGQEEFILPRLALLQGTKFILKNGLSLLGIKTPEKM